MKFAATLACAAAALTVALPAAAQNFQKTEDAIKYRRGAFTVMAAHFGALGAMANGRAPYDAQAAARHGDVLATVSHLPFGAFVPGSDKGETRARPEIWSESAKFKAAGDRMTQEVQKLAAASKTGDLDKLKEAFRSAGPSCKACHDDFRKN